MNVSQELLAKAAAKSLKAKLPEFRVGDTVSVAVRVVEGDKERIQNFRGVVIKRRGGGIGETFTVRRIVSNEGVERTFPLHSPFMTKVEIVRSGRIRRAKLYYLRDRVGKATRLRDRAMLAAVVDESQAAEKADEKKA
jgi:large subunit ribosomal protein L19